VFAPNVVERRSDQLFPINLVFLQIMEMELTERLQHQMFMLNLMGMGNPLPSLPSRQTLIEEMTRWYDQMDAMKKTNPFSLHNSYRTLLPGRTRTCPLNAKNAITIDHLLRSVNTPVDGKFFFCRTITPPGKMTSVMCCVEDKNGAATRIAFYGLTTASRNSELNSILPIGTFLAVLNPYMKIAMDGNLIVRVENRAGLQFLDPPTVISLLGGTKWGGEIPSQFLNRYRRNPMASALQAHVKDHTEDLALGKSGEALKRKGNEHFVAKRFYEAIECYTSALKLGNNDNDSVLLCNRAAAYNNTAHFHLALQDTNIVLKSDPTNVKAIFR